MGKYVLKRVLISVFTLLVITLVLFIGFFFYRDGARIYSQLEVAAARLSGELGHRLLELAANTVKAVMIGIVGTAAAQALVALVGFLIAGEAGDTVAIGSADDIYTAVTACTINSGGANGIGPNLFGVLGKKHGHMAGFAYSPGLLAKEGNWDFDGMNEWLKSPKKYVDGTKMSFAGLPKIEDRANLIAYLKSLGG